MSELTIMELDSERSELLPNREALNGFKLVIGSGNLTGVYSKATAVQAITAFSHNSASSTVAVVNGVVVLL